ncbi:MAG: recombinase RecA [Candidatus Acetothermia bacterium]|jgi:recombination protein RecA|nr:recombinase RecA [Candidatus Acetothermia bacterium]
MGKKEVLDGVLNQIRKAYGEGAIMWLGDESVVAVDVVPTGSLALDIALGVGGVPRGRMVEIFGPEASGKTTLALHIIAEAQKLGGTAAFIDAEHALDPGYTRAIGVDLDHLLLSQPSSGEQALEITEQLVRSGAVDVIVIDSVAALVPEAELQGQMGDAQVGLQARLMSQAMRKLAAAIAQSKTTTVFVNQIRATIQPGPWGPGTTTTGGRALKFYASVRLNIWGEGKIAEGDDRVGMKAHVRVVKNKVAPPFREATFDVIYGRGIVRERDLINTGIDLNVVSRSGSWYSYGDVRLGQGMAQAAQFLTDNPEIADQIARDIREKAKLPEPRALADEG